jgi:probable F420-dependent oxidoreductase
VTKVFVSCGLLQDEEVVALAPHVERLGFDGVMLPDHVFMPVESGDYPYSSDGSPTFPRDAPWPDPFVLIGALAMITERLRFMTTVVVLPLRHPLLLAKSVAAAARLSRGRLMLGVGLGWQREEFEALGIDFTKRGAIADETIEVLRALSEPGPVEHHGRFFSFGPLYLEPAPPRVPIIVGGSSEAARQRAVRLGDGYVLPVVPFGEMPSHVESLRALLAERGRDASGFEIVIRGGTPTGAELEPLLALDVGTIGVTPWSVFTTGPTSHAEKLGALERCAAEILPRVHSRRVRP